MKLSELKELIKNSMLEVSPKGGATTLQEKDRVKLNLGLGAGNKYQYPNPREDEDIMPTDAMTPASTSRRSLFPCKDLPIAAVGPSSSEKESCRNRPRRNLARSARRKQRYCNCASFRFSAKRLPLHLRCASTSSARSCLAAQRANATVE